MLSDYGFQKIQRKFCIFNRITGPLIFNGNNALVIGVGQILNNFLQRNIPCTCLYTGKPDSVLPGLNTGWVSSRETFEPIRPFRNKILEMNVSDGIQQATQRSPGILSEQ